MFTWRGPNKGTLRVILYMGFSLAKTQAESESWIFSTGCLPGSSEIAPLWGLLCLPPHWAHPETDGSNLSQPCRLFSHVHEQGYWFRPTGLHECLESDAERDSLLLLILAAVGGWLERISLPRMCFLYSSRCKTLPSLLF